MNLFKSKKQNLSPTFATGGFVGSPPFRASEYEQSIHQIQAAFAGISASDIPRALLSRESESTTATVEEIHEAFSEATDRTVEQAKGLLDNARVKKAERLKKLGFHKHPEKKGAEADVRLVARSKEELRLSEYYKQKYNAKFISDSAVHELTKKYGLILGEISDFIGYIPESAIDEIEKFQSVDKSDEGIEYGDFRSVFGAQTFLFSDGFLSREQKRKSQRLRIVAPLKDFDTTGKTIENNVLKMRPAPDPIVLKVVNGGYLIVAMWGPEAELPEVQ